MIELNYIIVRGIVISLRITGDHCGARMRPIDIAAFYLRMYSLKFSTIAIPACTLSLLWLCLLELLNDISIAFGVFNPIIPKVTKNTKREEISQSTYPIHHIHNLHTKLVSKWYKNYCNNYNNKLYFVS